MRGSSDGGFQGEPMLAGVTRHAVRSAAARGTWLVVSCPTCGSDLSDRKKNFALSCHSCGGFVMPQTDQAEREQPDALVPFALDEGAARTAFAGWVSSRRFAPQTLVKGTRQARTVAGVFLPFWSYGASTRSSYVGERGVPATRLVLRTHTDAEGKTQTSLEPESYTEWHRVSGVVGRHFDGILVPGCSPLTEKVPAWPLGALAPFPQHGAPPERRVVAYDVEPQSGFDRARATMDAQIEQDVRSDIGGVAQRIGGISTDYNTQTYSLLLLPAYLVSYTHDGRTYSALVNGATGEVAGERPYSAAKITILVAVLAAIAAAAVILLTWH